MRKIFRRRFGLLSVQVGGQIWLLWNEMRKLHEMVIQPNPIYLHLRKVSNHAISLVISINKITHQFISGVGKSSLVIMDKDWGKVSAKVYITKIFVRK